MVVFVVHQPRLRRGCRRSCLGGDGTRSASGGKHYRRGECVRHANRLNSRDWSNASNSVAVRRVLCGIANVPHRESLSPVYWKT